MFVLNKNTGLKWDVDGELLERLKKDDDYELVKDVKKDEHKKTSSKPTTKKKSANK